MQGAVNGQAKNVGGGAKPAATPPGGHQARRAVCGRCAVIPGVGAGTGAAIGAAAGTAPVMPTAFHCRNCAAAQPLADWWLEIPAAPRAGLRLMLCGYCPRGHIVKAFIARPPLESPLAPLDGGRAGYRLDGAPGAFTGELGDAGRLAAAIESGFAAARAQEKAARDSILVRLTEHLRREGKGRAMPWHLVGAICGVKGTTAKKIYSQRPKDAAA